MDHMLSATCQSPLPNQLLPYIHSVTFTTSRDLGYNVAEDEHPTNPPNHTNTERCSARPILAT